MNYLRLLDGPCRISSVDGSPDKVILTDCPVLGTSGSSNLTLSPGGDLVLGPAGNDVLPNTGYTQNLGALSNKYLTLHAAELWVETLVAQNTIATIGGRVLVAPTTVLTVDLAPAATTITVKHNEMANGDRIYLEANGAVEWMAVTSGPSGGGPYAYTVTRNLDGSGANQWYAGDAVLNTGTTGDGFIDLYSFSGVLSGSGPTIVGNVRTGTTYNQVAARWAIGNLNGLYGYGATTYGVAMGDPSATNITIDATNGFRIRSSTTNKLVADTSGNLSLTGDLSIGSGGSFRMGGATAYGTGTGLWVGDDSGTYKFRIGNPAGNQLAWNGSTLSITGNGNGLTSIGPGSLTLGTGRNIVRNSDCSVSTTDWTTGTDSGLTQTLSFALAGYRLNDQTNTCYWNLAGTPAAGKISYVYTTTALRYPVAVGSKYEASVYLGVHRSGNTQISIQWYDSAGSFLSQSDGSTCTTAKAGGYLITDFCRSTLVATAPASATTAGLLILTTHTAELNPYVFYVRSYFGEAQSGQTDATPWAPAGLTEIVGGNIKTSTITADKISVSTLSAISANIGTITAGSISGVTATFGGTVTLDSSGVTITSGTSSTNKIKWSGGGTIYDSSGSMNITAPSDITLAPGGSNPIVLQSILWYPLSDNNADIGTSSVRMKNIYTYALNLGSGTITKSGWGGSGNRYVCVDNNGAVFVQASNCT